MDKINFVNDSLPALSAQNLNQLQTNVENAIDATSTYLTSETVVGEWIDGKPIYRKVLDLGGIGTSSTSIERYIDGNYYDTIVNFDGYIYSGNNKISLTNFFSVDMYINICYSISNNLVKILINRNNAELWSEWGVKIIIDYTKTTD